MYLEYLTLINYGGIYNGLGLNRIDLDFGKCQHKICLIKGDNGSGKSTIMNALKPLPDSNTDIIPGLYGEKIISYLDQENGKRYTLNFIHDVNSNGTRATVKGYIVVTDLLNRGATQDLNPSGNISSCKDLIYDIFQLDPGFLALTQLSAGKRGLADMKPVERKKFVNGILSQVEVYNELHKKLTKKATLYKGLINNNKSKLSTIGDLGKIEIELQALEKQIDEMEKLIMDSAKLQSQAEIVIMSDDPNGELVMAHNRLIGEISNYQSNIQLLSNHINDFCIKNKVDMKIDILDLEREITRLETRLSEINNTVTEILKKREIDTIELTTKQSKLRDIGCNESLKDLKARKEKYNSALREIYAYITKMGLKTEHICKFDRAAIENAIITLASVRDTICSPQFADKEYLARCIQEFSIPGFAKSQIVSLEQKISTHRSELEDTRMLVVERNSLYKSTLVLKDRPAKCKDDTCPFISSAIQASKRYEYLKSLELEDTINGLEIDIKNEEEERTGWLNVISGAQVLKAEKGKIDGVSYVLSNLTNGDFKDALDFMNYGEGVRGNLVQTIEHFNYYVDFLYSHISLANMLESMRSYQSELDKVNMEISKLSAHEELINIIMADIDRLNNLLNEASARIDSLNEERATLTENVAVAKLKLDNLKQAKDALLNISKANNELEVLTQKLSLMEAKQSKVLVAHQTIENCKEDIARLREQLDPLKKKRDDIKTTLRLSGTYIQELKEQEETLGKIEAIRYFCSPSTGIQLMFANVYLNKILMNANQLLANLFGGIFNILPFVITPDEFRIPIAVQGGINHDDITSMSSAQIAMISMIISISMLSQVSTKMNIIVGDEIDASLDTENRRIFFDILLMLMDMVNSHQCFLISHNSEYTQNNCDVIWLRHNEAINENGNVIFDYEAYK